MLIVRFEGSRKHIGAMLEPNDPNDMKPNRYERIHAWFYFPQPLDYPLIVLTAIDLQFKLMKVEFLPLHGEHFEILHCLHVIIIERAQRIFLLHSNQQIDDKMT